MVKTFTDKNSLFCIFFNMAMYDKDSDKCHLFLLVINLDPDFSSQTFLFKPCKFLNKQKDHWLYGN